ncbi:DUF5335 family protein [Verrucomicrobiota bacterium sgz303538]
MSTGANLETKEIPKEDWVSFFNDFSGKHRGWMVSIEEESEEIGDQEETDLLPFVGISADLKDRENRIAIMVGGKKGSDINRIIDTPDHVWFKHGLMEQYDAIDVESKDGTKTLLQFRFVPSGQTESQLPPPKQ